MAGFVFSLESVLNYRSNVEKECKLRLEEAVNIRNKLKEMLVTERDLYFSDRDELNKTVKNSIINKVNIYEKSLDIRKKRMLELLEKIRDAENEVDMAEQNLVQARKNMKSIENLRERRETEYNKKIELKEAKLLDEYSTVKEWRSKHAS